MAVVLLVRHGQASFGAADYDVLSATGEQQATAVGVELARRAVRPVVAVSGTLRRQRATGRLALRAAELDLPLTEDPRWNEYDHVALTEHLGTGPPPADRSFQQVLEQALHEWIRAGASAGAAGSYPDFAARTGAALDDLLAGLGRGGTAVVFTSGGVIATLVTRLLGLPAAGFLAVNRVVANGGISKLVHGRSGTSLVSFNEHGHFDGPAGHLLTYR